jgi:inosine-uridine nucleoside N-ribohydrolase
MDDQWALAHLLLSPEIDLQGIITTHAASVQLSAATTQMQAVQVIEHVSPDRLRSLPVLAGSDVPLQDRKTPRRNVGVDLLLRQSRTFSQSHRLVVFVIGAATDVASAILLDPSIAKRVTVVAMGFNDWPAGGDPFNVKNDPLAWQVVLDSEVPVVVGSSAVTSRGLRLTRDEAATLMRPHGPVGEYLHSLFEGWMKRMPAAMLQQITGTPETWVVWDEVVVAYALGMARGNDVPRPQLQSDLSFAHPETSRRITWLTEIDTQRVWRDFTKKIDARGQQRTPTASAGL